MLRVALVVLLALAVLAAGLPAVESAQVDHADRSVRTELDAVRTAVEDLLVHDDPVRGGGARRVVAVRLPDRAWGSAGVARVVLGDGPAGRRLAWRVRGGRPRSLRIPVPVVRSAGRPLVLGGGRHQLVLSLVPGDAGPVVVVRRRFKSDDATRAGRAGVRRRPARRLPLPAGVRG